MNYSIRVVFYYLEKKLYAIALTSAVTMTPHKISTTVTIAGHLATVA